MGKHFGTWLKARRETLGLNTRDLGDSAECSHNSISLMERGKFDPTPDLRGRLAKALGVTIEEVTLATFPDRFDENERPLLKQWLSVGDDLPC